MIYLISTFPHCNFESFFFPQVDRQDTRCFVYFLPLRASVWGCISICRNNHVQFPNGPQFHHDGKQALSCVLLILRDLGKVNCVLCFLPTHSESVVTNWEDSVCAVDRSELQQADGVWQGALGSHLFTWPCVGCLLLPHIFSFFFFALQLMLFGFMALQT